MENEEKKQGKHIYAIFFSPTSQQKNQNNFKTGWQVTYKKKEEAVNRSVRKEATFQNLAVKL